MTTEAVHHRPARTVRHPGPVVLALAAALACGDGGTEPSPPPPPPPPDPPRPTTVTVSPATARLSALGATVQLGARVLDQRGQVMSGAPLTWTSSDVSVATVDGSGLVTAAGNGETTVTAASGGLSGEARVSVMQSARSVTVSPSAERIMPGDTLRLSARAVDGNGHAVAGAEFAWSSSDVSVASVDGTGLVLGVAPGEAAIRAISGTVQGTADITVESADRAALVAFYQAAGGPGWTRSSGWLTDASIGQWYGVTTDQRGVVVRLHLSANGLTGAIPPEVGNLAGLESLHLGANRLTGPVPPELGNLAGLETLWLHANMLTGPIPPGLGNLASLETLWLHDNDLSGPVPPEFGAMSSLRQLYLGSNPSLDGTLPSRLTALTRLDELLAGDTGLCAPADSDFQAWLEGVYRVRIARCAARGQPAAYLTQAVQSREFPVPLVAGERALLRVFPTALKETGEGIPLVRARFYRDGVETHEVDIPGKSTPIPTEVDEGDLAKSANAEIPRGVVQDGLEMVVEIDPDSTLDPALGVTKRIPEEGRLALEVKDMPPLDLTLIPFIWSRTQDSAIVDLIEEMAHEREDHEMFGKLHLLPVGEVHVTAHDPVVSSTNNMIGLLRETIAIRIMEGGTGHYQGMMSPPVTGARGVAFAPGRSSVSVPNAGTIAHELGHNFNLRHAPCGDPAALDPFYPQSDGSIGAWGYDFRDGESLVPPSTPDLMSYCRPNRWISDYGFTSALRFRGADADSVALPHRGSSQSLLLWGGIDARGTPLLEPAFVVDAPPALPDSAGEYRLVGRTADGAELFSLSFGMPAVLDGDGSSSFAFALPAQSSWEVSLASITLSGPGGSVTLDGDSSAPMTILRDPRTGRVRGMIRGLPPTAPAEADAAARISAGGSVAVLFSRGIPDMEAWHR